MHRVSMYLMQKMILSGKIIGDVYRQFYAIQNEHGIDDDILERRQKLTD